MKIDGRLNVLLAALLLIQATTSLAGLRPRDRTLSASRQFAFYSEDPILSAHLCARAESLKRGWLNVLGLSDQWRDPIIVLLETPADEGSKAPPIATQTLLFENQLRYQIRCLPPYNEDAILLALMDALCREYANRKLALRPPLPQAGANLPLWLVTGLAEMVAEKQAILLPVIQRSVEGGRPLTLAVVAETAGLPENEAERQLYRAHAWLLVESLLILPKGLHRCRQLLSEASPGMEPAELFDKLYANDIGFDVEREKWWALQLARKTVMRVAQSLSAVESARQLDEILRLHLKPTGHAKPKEVNFADWGQYAEEPWFRGFCQDRYNLLVTLRGRFHPFYYETAASYLEALNQLGKGRTGAFRSAARLAARQRVAADRQAHAFREYLDQAEQTYGSAAASQLPAYLEAIAKTEKPLSPKGSDPIRDYLDKFDRSAQ